MDVDTGAMLRGKYDREAKRFINPDHMYVNTHGETIETLRKMQELGLKPRFGMRELGHIRHLEAFMDMGLIEEPLLLKFGFNDDLLYNLPPEPRSIQAFLDWLPGGLDYEWFTQSQGASHHIVNNSAILMGGHIRTGIGDNLLYEGKPMSTPEQVRRVAEASRSLGRDVATPAEARQIMRLEPSKSQSRRHSLTGSPRNSAGKGPCLHARPQGNGPLPAPAGTVGSLLRVRRATVPYPDQRTYVLN